MNSPAALLSDDSPVDDASEPLITVRDVNHYFGRGANRSQVLFNINLTLKPGTMAVMTGPSGSGKTTLLTLIGGLRSIQEGSIRLLGRELHGSTAAQLTVARRKLGFIFQSHNLLQSLSAQQNVRMALQLHSIGRSEMNQRSNDVLSRVGLSERLHHKPRQLSVGQQQRVAIARALVSRPKIVLADEPTASLDKKSAQEVLQFLKEFTVTEGTSVLMVTHDSRVLDHADRVVNLVDGAIVSETEVEETVSISEFLAQCPVFQQNRDESAEVFRELHQEQFVLPNSPRMLTELARKMERVRVPGGTILFREGDPGDRFFIIREGEFEVIRDVDGQPRAVAILKRGDFFGEVALIRDLPRNATLRCISDAVIYGLDKKSFLAAVNVTGSLDRQIRDTLYSQPYQPGEVEE